MKKPLSIKVLLFIMITKLLIYIIFLSLLFLVLVIKSNNEIWIGFGTGLLSSLDIERSTYTSIDFAYLLGTFFTPTLFVISTIVFTNKRKYKLLITMLALQILLSINSGFSFILITILLLIVVFKNYFENINNNVVENYLSKFNILKLH